MIPYNLFTIKLPLVIGIAIVGVLTLIAWRGKLAIIAGTYTAITYWITSPIILGIRTGGLQFNWVLIPLLLIAWLTYLIKSDTPVVQRGVDKVFFLLIFFWVLWILLLILVFGLSPDLQKTLFLSVFFYLVLVLLPILALSHKTKDVKEFAISFMMVFIIEASYAYYRITDTNIMKLIAVIQPVIFANSLAINYHNFAKVSSIAFIFCLTLLFDPDIQGFLKKFVLCIVLLFSAFITVWSGARQYMIAAAISGLLFIVFASRAKTKWRWLSLVLCVVLGVGGWSFYSNYQYELRLDDPVSVNLRLSIYRTMWDWFAQSPIIGSGPYYGNSPSISHGFILDSLASEGIIGLLFLSVFIGFIFYYSRGSLSKRPIDSEQIWRVGALSLFLLGLIQSLFSSNVLSAHVVYLSSALIWGLSPRQEK